MLEDFEFSYSINKEEKIICFYYIIEKKVGVKAKISLPDYTIDTSDILFGLIERYYGIQEIADFDKVCLDLLDSLPGNLHAYPEITILYNMSNEDILGSVDLDNLDSYDGDMMKMENGELVLYSDLENHVIIESQNKLESGETIYSCMIDRNESEKIPNLFDDESNSPNASFAKEFVLRVLEITKRKPKGYLRELKKHYEK